jgi:hypothetical protein
MEKKTSTHDPCFCSLGYIYATLRLFFFSECEIKYEIFVTFKAFLAHLLRKKKLATSSPKHFLGDHL